MYEKRFEVCICLWQSLPFLGDLVHAVDKTLKFSYLPTN